jgi:hypothetical protein
MFHPFRNALLGLAVTLPLLFAGATTADAHRGYYCQPRGYYYHSYRPYDYGYRAPYYYRGYYGPGYYRPYYYGYGGPRYYGERYYPRPYGYYR